MENKIKLDFVYEEVLAGKPKKMVFGPMNKLEIQKAITAIREGQKIRDTEGPKLYGIVSGR